MPRATRVRTIRLPKEPGRVMRLYAGQANKQLRFLTQWAYLEARVERGRLRPGNWYTCKCWSCPDAPIRERRRGALDAILFLIEHRRHRTFVELESET